MQFEKVLSPIYDTIQANGGELVTSVLAGTEDRSFRSYLCENHTDSLSAWDNILPPNQETIVNKRIMLEFDVQVTASHASTAAWPTAFKPRAYAPLTAIDLATVGVNGKERSYQVSELIQVLTRYNNPHESADQRWLNTPTMQDYGTLNTNAYGSNLPRDFAGYELTSTGSGALLTKTYRFRCPIVGPGLEWGNEFSNDGLTLLSRLSVRLRWVTNLAKCLFDGTGSVVGQTYAATIPTHPTLVLEYITPSVKLNKTFLSYNMKDYLLYSKNVDGADTPADAAFTSIQSNTISYSVIPSAVYVYVAQPVTDLEVANDARIFADLSNVKISWMNKTINFESTDMAALQAMSVSNGFNVPIALQNGYVGMCCKFLVGRDLPLSADQFPGAAQVSGTISVSVSGVNQGVARKLNLYVLVENDSTMTIVEGSSDIVDGFNPMITKSLADGDFLPEVEGAGYMAGSISGGSMANFKKPLKRHLLSAWRNLMAHKSEILGDLNKSMGIAQKYKALQGGGQMGGRMLGGSYQSRF